MTYDIKFFAAVIPIVILNLVMIIWCISDLTKRKSFKLLDKRIWIVVILFIQLIGPLAYLLLGRGDDNDQVR